MALDEPAFEAVAEATLGRIESVLEDEADDLEVDRQGGILTIETADGATFVLNKHAPLRQLWLSSPVSGASHYDYDADRKRWISTRGGAGLNDVLSHDLSTAAGLTLVFGSDA